MSRPLAAVVALLPALLAGCTEDTQLAGDGTAQSRITGDLIVNNGSLRLVSASAPSVAPQLTWLGNRGAWSTGMDVANNGGSRDLVLASKLDWPAPAQVDDVVYLAHNDATAPTVGIGVTPPSKAHRLQVSAQDSEPEMGTMMLRRTPHQTGNVFTILDSGGTARWALDANYWLKGASPGTGASVSILADDRNGRPLVVAKPDGANAYGFQYLADGSGTLFLRYITGGINNIALNTNGRPGFPNGLTTTALTLDAPAVPSTSSDPCTRGAISYDASFVYVCIDTNTWKRSALAGW